ncbi:MAG: TIGR04282 family arsenosugar biosynthesis glycosyltransferase [Planctomycetes bacterium]|nr:TIGR04282 family arsenosugar biosynthesis glycosyltransferase [Planctomycetota bacterium]
MPAGGHLQTVLGIFAKHPVAGRVKTRLVSELGAEPSRQLYECFVRDVLEKFRARADRRIIGYTPATEEARAWFARAAGDSYELWPQPDGPLGERMATFFDHVRSQGPSRAVLIGSDSPTVPAEYIQRAFELLTRHDCVLGPATDGGYYLVGLKGRTPHVFEGIEWSSCRVLSQTVERVAECGASLEMLPPWYDVDTLDDVEFLRGHLAAIRLSEGTCDAPRTADRLKIFGTLNPR